MAERCRASGFDFATIDGQVYWDETAYYAFSLRQIEQHIEAATEELSALCLELVARVARDERQLRRLAIPPHAWPLIAESWQRSDPTLYGRFDLAYDGESPAKMLEYNADTPTSLFEAAVFQWLWLDDAREQKLIAGDADQFNSIHEHLIEQLARCCPARFSGASDAHVASARFTTSFKPSFIAPTRLLHLACMPGSAEDRGLIAYLAECAREAGIATSMLAIGDIGRRGEEPFVDLQNQPITHLFKLYPWEWMFADPFSHAPSMRKTRFIEPPWKAILSNKGILPLLWEMAPGHPNLLPAYFDIDAHGPARLAGSYASKPLYSREGSNVTLIEHGQVLDSDGGGYGAEGYVLQGLARMPRFDGQTPVIGSWVVGDRACGIGVREDASPITKNTSRFIPHAIVG